MSRHPTLVFMHWRVGDGGGGGEARARQHFLPPEGPEVSGWKLGLWPTGEDWQGPAGGGGELLGFMQEAARSRAGTERERERGSPQNTFLERGWVGSRACDDWVKGGVGGCRKMTDGSFQHSPDGAAGGGPPDRRRRRRRNAALGEKGRGKKEGKGRPSPSWAAGGFPARV